MLQCQKIERLGKARHRMSRIKKERERKRERGERERKGEREREKKGGKEKEKALRETISQLIKSSSDARSVICSAPLEASRFRHMYYTYVYSIHTYIHSPHTMYAFCYNTNLTEHNASFLLTCNVVTKYFLLLLQFMISTCYICWSHKRLKHIF